MGKKAVFLDLDGTLLDDGKRVSPGKREAVRRAVQAGHRVILCSGRPLKSVLLQAERLELAGPGCYVSAYNGAILYDCGEKRELFRKALPLEDVFRLFDEAGRRGVYIQTYENEDVVIEEGADPAVARRYCAGIELSFRVVRSVRQDLHAPPVKCLLIDFAGRSETEKMRQWALQEMAGKVESFFSGPFYLEVVPAGVDKGMAVRELCALLDIPREDTVAAGDEANDIPMIRAAGVGAAMKNAVPEVLSAADYITELDNNHDGAAEILERFVL